MGTFPDLNDLDDLDDLNDLNDLDPLVRLHGFEDMASRAKAPESFYGGPARPAHRDKRTRR